MDASIFIDRSSPLPLYAQLEEALKEEIRNGKIAFGEKLPSENDLMRTLGLSRMTVRNALAELERERYVNKIHGKGSFVCYTKDKTLAGTIDVLLDVTYAYFSSHYIKSISEVLTQHNYRFVIHDTQDDQVAICDILDRISAGNESAGIILQPSHRTEATLPRLLDCMQQINRQGIPFVMIDRAIENVPGVFVQFDDFAGGRAAAEYLCSLGHQRFAMVCCSKFTENKPRCDGFNAVLKERGLEALTVIEQDDDLKAPLEAAVRQGGVSAVFNYNDEVALQTIHALYSLGLRVPEDISVVGYDDTVLAEATNPPLTSVIHPKELLGRISAQKLISMIERYNYEIRDDLLTPRIKIRSSCMNAANEEGETP